MTRGVLLEPTQEQRRTVRAMAGFGVPHEGIAILLEIDPKTLRKHFQSELDRGSVEATAKVAQSLFQMATQGKNVAAAIFWMKARAGWREKHDVHVTHDNVSTMTDEELQREINRLQGEIYPDGLVAPAQLIEGSTERDSEE